MYGWGDWGDWALRLAGGLIAFGVASSSQAAGICSTTDVADGAWHHVAATRRASDGRIRVFVDGVLEGEAASGPTGDISYRDGRQAGWPNQPFLVIGAEKHDVGSEVPSFSVGSKNCDCRRSFATPGFHARLDHSWAMKIRPPCTISTKGVGRS